MVQGIPRLRARLNKAAARVEQEVERTLAKSADEIVAEMRALRPVEDIIIGWTWGVPPAGAVTLGRVAQWKKSSIRITIYANAITSDYPGGFPAVARWHEFGTAPRFRKSGGYTGLIAASPYFFPVYRANRRRARGRITRAVRKAAQSS